MFVGVSHAHSSNVGRILNCRTGNFSSQYHVVYDDLFTTVPNRESGGLLEQLKFNPVSWLRILETGWERFVDPIDEASSSTSLVPSLDREWLSDDELPPSATNDDPEPDPPSQPINIPVPPEPPSPKARPTSIRSSSEGNVVPTTDDELKTTPIGTPEGPISSSEGNAEDRSDQEIKPDLTSSSKYWDEDLPEKRRKKPNPKYVQHAERFIHHANSRQDFSFRI
jgi:hypothetical protein